MPAPTQSALAHEPRIGVQLYTLRHEMRDGLENGLHRLLELARDCGYRWVELFGGLHEMEARQLKDTLDTLGLGVVASHLAIETLEAEDLGKVLDDHQIIGCDSVVCPWLPPDRRGGRERYRELGRTLDRIGYRFKARGMRLGYHNHDFEFTTDTEDGRELDGLREILAQATHPALFAEIDVYWLAFAGIDPVAYLHRIAHRVGLVHLKDGWVPPRGERRPAEDARFAPLGDGDVDIAAVVAAALRLEVPALIVEQDHCEGAPTDAIRRSLEYLEPLLEQDAPESSEPGNGHPTALRSSP